MALTLACAGSATLSSAYFVIWLSRTDIPVGDLPPGFFTTWSLATLDGSIANWGFGSAPPTPSMGTWSPTVTYTTGDTVGSLKYKVLSADGTTLNYPIVYRSLIPGNLNHNPDNWDGYWTCTTQAPGFGITNSNFGVVPFAYILSPLPTKTDLSGANWKGSLGHSLFWGPMTPPGDVVQLIDMYVLLNYLVGSSIVHTISRPLHNSVITGSQGLIVNPGINAQIQCWFTSGLSSTPQLTLDGFDLTAFVNGMQPGSTVGAAYLSSLVASGGTTPYAYAIIAGELPPGVTLDGTTGVISGTPTASGIFDFTAQVTDSTGATATVTCAAPIECGAGAVAANNSFY